MLMEGYHVVEGVLTNNEIATLLTKDYDEAMK